MKIICPKVEHRNGALEINGVLEINNVFEAYGSQTSLWIWITWAILLKCTFWFTRSGTESETAFLTRFQVIWCYRSIAQTLNSKFRSVQSLSHVRLFVTPWTATCQASLSITNCWNLLKLMSIEMVLPSNHFILCHPLLLLPSLFPRIRVFSNQSLLCIRWPKYWSFSFNISPSDEYSGLFPLGWTGWISLQSKGLSRVFSNTTVQKHQFSGA